MSSVAPTSVHHSALLSNVYQTSSIKVQPVEPQTVGNKQVQSPQSLILSPPQCTSTPLNGTPEVCLDKSPKPALPPKPAIKPPPRQTQSINETDPPPIPSSEPPDDTNPNKLKGSQLNKSYSAQSNSNSVLPANNQTNEMIIKAKPLTIKKQPMSEQPKLRTTGYSSSKINGLISRREITTTTQQQLQQQTFNFPELVQQNHQLIESKVLEDENKIPSTDEPDRIHSEEEPIREHDNKEPEAKGDGVIRRCKKGNLKQTGKSNLSRRVSFDPLALLLDASLEGELELVKKTATQVTNPSAANDEGITALHNAICAGHLEIVKYLVGFGCDVNAQDSDGWTPLHCAASCNNVAMVKFLVEHGACIFATTLSDHETAAEKCEEDEEGFDGCSEYLYSK